MVVFFFLVHVNNMYILFLKWYEYLSALDNIRGFLLSPIGTRSVDQDSFEMKCQRKEVLLESYSTCLTKYGLWCRGKWMPSGSLYFGFAGGALEELNDNLIFYFYKHIKPFHLYDFSSSSCLPLLLFSIFSCKHKSTRQL